MAEQPTEGNDYGADKVIETRYGDILKRGDDWRFQWTASRAGRPKECDLRAATAKLPVDMTKRFCDEINAALRDAGETFVIAGGRVNPRHYLG